MKRSIVSLLLCVATLTFVGCANWWQRSLPSSGYSRSYHPTTIALAITVNGVLQPTPQQYALVQAAAVRQFSQLGYTIVTDLSLAERIVRIDFTPDATDPENSGRAHVLGFRSNPYYATASNTGYAYGGYYPTAFGYAGSFSNANWYALNNFGYGYYGYMNSYYDGYTYSSPTLNPTRPTVTTPTQHVHPPYRHDSNHCPPDMHRVKPLDGTLASEFTPVTPNNYPPSGRREPGRWYGGGDGGGGSGSASTSYAASSRGSGDNRGSWRDRASASGTDRSTTASTNSDRSSRSSWWSGRGDSSYSSSNSSYSPPSTSSYSSSSYSSPSYSSSDSSSSGSSYSGGGSSSSSSSSYSGSGSTVETTPSRNAN